MAYTEKATYLGLLGETLRDARTKRHFSQSEVAEMAGITQSHYSLIENGKRDADFFVVVKLCQILNVDLCAIIAKFL